MCVCFAQSLSVQVSRIFGQTVVLNDRKLFCCRHTVTVIFRKIAENYDENK